jgi:hypothetical protein
MKIKVRSDYPEGSQHYSFPLGSVHHYYVHIGSITLNRAGNSGGQINEAQAKTLLADAIRGGAEIVIKFDKVEITLK